MDRPRDSRGLVSRKTTSPSDLHAWALLGGCLPVLAVLERPASAITPVLFLTAIVGGATLLRRTPRPRMGGVLLALAAGVLIALLCTLRVRSLPVSPLSLVPDKTDIAVRGTLLDAPQMKDADLSFPLAVDALVIGDEALPAEGTVLARIDRFRGDRLRPGGRVIAMGTLEHPDDEGYARYLAVNGIAGTLALDRVDTIGAEPSIRAFLKSLRPALAARARSLVPEPHATFLVGILAGGSSGLPDRWADALRTVGISHITAISGSNITIILSFLGGLLFWLPLKWRTLPLALAVIGFVVAVGASASAVRAAAMGILGLVAIHAGRQNTVRLSVGWTATAMVAINPAMLFDDLGFQLSFLAVIGIAELQKPIRPLLGRLPLADELATTLAANAATAPCIACSFGTFSVVSPLANLLAAPLVPIAMAAGALTIATSWISPALATLPALATWFTLDLIGRIAFVLSALPYASLDFEAPLWAIVVWYGLTVGGGVWLKRRIVN